MSRQFTRRTEEIREAAKYEQLNILVWGPGDPGTQASAGQQRAYQKRLQIKDELRREFPRSEVYFSEDPEMETLTEDIKGQLRKEAVQAGAADLIIMLDISQHQVYEKLHISRMSNSNVQHMTY